LQNVSWVDRTDTIGDPTLADSILDRLVHNAHRIEMRGESMRKKRGDKE
jgi:DNA replication protein DnaC